MPPRLILIRHGQAFHNVPPEDHSIPDPFLTPLGESQVKSIPSHYPALFSSLSPSTTLLLSSPFRRTLQTTLHAFSSHLPPSETPLPIVFLPQLQECGKEPCDTGSPLEEIKSTFPEWIDWSWCETEDGWNENKGFYEATPERQAQRGRWVRRWVRERKEDTVVVVSHHGFLRCIAKIPQVPGVCQWPNAEVREYQFNDPTGEDEEADVTRVVDAIL